MPLERDRAADGATSLRDQHDGRIGQAVQRQGRRSDQALDHG
jgi:hypothetical protein